MAIPALARFEVTGSDGLTLRRFYRDLFGWTIQAGALGSGFGVVPPAAGGISGVIGPDHSGGTGHVTFYVEVDDLAEYLARRRQNTWLDGGFEDPARQQRFSAGRQ